jgi:hypothetical protein
MDQSAGPELYENRYRMYVVFGKLSSSQSYPLLKQDSLRTDHTPLGNKQSPVYQSSVLH